MTQMITRCPECATSFRITEAQLKTAKGSVRCGSCLKIFRAQDHLVPQKAAPPKEAPQKAVPPKTAGTAPKASAKPKPSPAAKPASRATTTQPNPFMKAPAASRPAAKTPPPPTKPAPAKPAAATKPQSTASAPSSPPRQTKAPEPPTKETSEEGLLPSLDYGSDYDELHIEKDNISADLGQENMLVFDQHAIDDEAEIGDLGEDDLISDEMSFHDDDEVKPTFSSRSLGEDLSESILELDTSWRPKEKSLFDHEAKPPKEDDDENKDKSDESWAINMLEEMEDDEGFGDSFVQPPPPQDDNDNDEDRPRDDYSRTTTGTFSALDDSEIDDTFNDGLGAELELRSTAREEITALEDDDDESLLTSNESSDYGLEDEDDYYTADEDRDALLSRIEPEPVDMGWHSGTRNLRKKLLWGGMVAAGVLVLIIQVAWLQFDVLGRTEPYRSWYGAVCPLLGCKVPTMTARDRIHAYNLVVRSHPEASNALMVDTILLNTAPFAQPFPDVVLSFSNVNGKVLAARKFSPQEYLAGELAGRTQMPSQQPIHLSLEIVDPGPEAVNYTAYIP